MPNIKINAISVKITSDKGLLGKTIQLEEGLNVIRAENTSGKSSLVNAFLYALGLEMLLGKSGIACLKPCLKSEGEFNGQPYKVLESYVQVELDSLSRGPITVQRQIVGEKDNKLVDVFFGKTITSQEPNLQKKSFYVHDPGSAQREAGFYTFFADYFDLELPKVPKFKGNDVPLYIECIMPLMFIEQIRGWGGILATQPKVYGIRNVAKVAVEYLLNLDIFENEKKREEIQAEHQVLKGEWKQLVNKLETIALSINGTAENIPTTISTEIESTASIFFLEDETPIPVDEYLVKERELLDVEDSSSFSPSKEVLGEELSNNQDKLIFERARLSKIRNDLAAENNTRIQLKDRMGFVKKDIDRNRDAIKLKKFGSDVEANLASDICPTCQQKIEDTLIPCDSPVMDIESNLSFLKTELDAAKILHEACSKKINQLEAMFTSQKKIVSDLQALIRDMKNDVSDSNAVSVAKLREQIQRSERIGKIENARDDFNNEFQKFYELARLYTENRKRFSELPEEFFSEEDRDKLDSFSKQFAKDMEAFGYRSAPIHELYISDDSYRPERTGFEIAFDSSASDNIRIIWAYTLALLQVSNSYNTNHWGFCFFDEPEQQNMKDASSDAFYSQLGKMNTSNCQIIVTTSAKKEDIASWLTGIDSNFIECGDLVFTSFLLS